MPNQQKLTLKLHAEHQIIDKAVGLNEPSGLTLNGDGTALYTVSDDTKAIFKLDLKGRLNISDSFFIDIDDLEGIAISSDGKRLYSVQEATNSIISIDIGSRKVLRLKPLAAMQNYNSIAKYFADTPDNKGLEGITVNSDTNHLFVVKESQPGLLIQISADHNQILDSRLLTKRNGFSHPELETEKLDFSGLSYDKNHHSIWITSDKGKCLFHYDWSNDIVLQRLDLNLDTNSKSKSIRKSEGVAYDPTKNRLYVISERDGRLYVYKIHEEK